MLGLWSRFISLTDVHAHSRRARTTNYCARLRAAVTLILIRARSTLCLWVSAIIDGAINVLFCADLRVRHSWNCPLHAAFFDHAIPINFAKNIAPIWNDTIDLQLRAGVCRRV